jgi:hypothetical protein
MGWFGPSKDEAWQLLSEEIGAEFVAGGFWKGGSKVQAHVGPWIVTLDTYKVRRHHHPYRQSHVTYTRMRAPLREPRTLSIHDLSQGLLQRSGQAAVDARHRGGCPEFDEAFIIKGNDEGQVCALFANPKIRQLIQDQPKIRLEVKDSEGWFGPKFPEDVDELHFQVVGVIKDVERLKALFDLFAVVLDQLCRIGSAHKEEAGVEL